MWIRFDMIDDMDATNLINTELVTTIYKYTNREKNIFNISLAVLNDTNDIIYRFETEENRDKCFDDLTRFLAKYTVS